MAGHRPFLAALACLTVLSACAATDGAPDQLGRAQAAPSTETTSPGASTPTPARPETKPAPAPRPEPQRSFLSVERLGLEAFPVVRYRGSPDDAPGTAIQNDGAMASPRGRRGGVGPGEIGNFIVTGHRLSSTAPFRYLPSVPRGARVQVRARDTVHVYEIIRTRRTSFRSPASLAAQRAPVPGRPGVEAKRAMITLSTCATIEDHAAGNYWSDEFDNPEHRIDKIGVLVRSFRA